MSTVKHILHILGISVLTLTIAFSTTWILAKIPVLAPVTDSVLDFEFTDQAFKTKDYTAVPRDTNIFIVNVADHSRYQLATIIDTLNEHKPNSICLNVIFSKRKQHFVDSILENSFSRTQNLYFVGGIVDDQIFTSHSSFTQYGAIGSGNLILGLKNSIRDFNTHTEYNGISYPHIGIAGANAYAPQLTSQFLERNNDSETINYIGDIQKFPVIDFDSNGNLTVFTSNELGYFVKDSLLTLNDVQDKIVLFGFITDDISEFDPSLIDPLDAFSTPLPYLFSWLGDMNLPNTKGVVIHANIISTILNQAYINKSIPVNVLLNVLVIILSAALFYYLSLRVPGHYGIITKALAIMIMVILIFITLFIFRQFSYKYDPRWAILVLLFLSDSTEIYLQYIFKRFQKLNNDR